MEKSIHNRWLGLATSLVLWTASSSNGATWFVKPGPVSGSGTSWQSAFNNLQEALAVANVGDQIWVAAGIYVPGSARSDSFELLPGVQIYGGFAGFETQLGDRDWEANVSILSGEIGVLGDETDNSFVVVKGESVTQTAQLDGFTITGGYGGYQGFGYGAGLFIGFESSPTFQNCLILRNQAPDWGGGAYVEQAASPRFINCTFRENHAGLGGALFVQAGQQSQPVITGCKFIDNVAENDSGALYNGSFEEVRLLDCIFIGNEARTGSGGAVGRKRCQEDFLG